MVKAKDVMGEESDWVYIEMKCDCAILSVSVYTPSMQAGRM